ncbi:MAG: YfhO family protein, partial [Bacteroidetes bacterium]|nr:YfhO family protein [Bacteroidota bacterium]
KNVTIVIAILSALVIIDMWTIDKRYLNDSNFTTKAKIKVPFTPTEADLMILQDKEPDYRVYNLTVNPFQDASTSYFHNSIGGYCAVKMKRYQELIEKQISKQNMNVINMLNTRYFITADSVGNPVARRNPNALGNAWFVDKYKLVANADSELNALSNFDPSVTAIIDKRFESTVSNYKNTKDTTATIKLISYKPNNLLYQSKTTKEQLAVFSEIYYNKGWNVYIDQKLTPYFRANYVLRAMKIPAGEHVIEWKFEPAVFYTGQKVSLTFNLLLIIVVIGSIFLEFRNKKPTI